MDDLVLEVVGGWWISLVVDHSLESVIVSKNFVFICRTDLIEEIFKYFIAATVVHVPISVDRVWFDGVHRRTSCSCQAA